MGADFIITAVWLLNLRFYQSASAGVICLSQVIVLTFIPLLLWNVTGENNATSCFGSPIAGMFTLGHKWSFVNKNIQHSRSMIGRDQPEVIGLLSIQSLPLDIFTAKRCRISTWNITLNYLKSSAGPFNSSVWVIDILVLLPGPTVEAPGWRWWKKSLW